MITILLSSDRQKKDEELIKRIKSSDKTKDIILITPEQISLTIEQDMQNKLKGRVTVLSFKRLIRTVFKEYGQIQGEYATETSKLIALEQTMNEVKDELIVFKNQSLKKGFIKLIGETIENLKSSGLNDKQFRKLNLQSKKLKQKINDVQKIKEVYEGILTSIYKDPSDDLKRSINLAREKDFFKNKQIYIDYFYSYTGEQYQMIETMAKQTDVTFLMTHQNRELFETVNQTIDKITTMSVRSGIKVKKPERIDEKENFYPNVADFFGTGMTIKPENAKEIEVIVYTPENEYDEAEQIASQIIDFTKQGVRYNEMIILSTDLKENRGALKGSLERNEIPYYIDEKKVLNELSIINCCRFILEASTTYSVNALQNILKSNITKFNQQEISIFENYIYTWEIDKKRIKEEFYNNPRGFVSKGDEVEEDREKLDIANNVRKELLKAIEVLRETKESSKEISLGLLKALDVLGVKDELERKIKIAQREQAVCLKRSWDVNLSLLEEIVKCIKNNYISLKRYKEIYELLSEQTQLSEVPQTIDTLLIGDINTTLSKQKKVVIILGANEGCFPKIPIIESVFTQSENQQLSLEDIKINKTINEVYATNKLKAYEAMNLATEKLILSASLNNISGKTLYRSLVIENAIKLLGQQIVVKNNKLDILNSSQTKESAFMNLLTNYNVNDEKVSKLKEYFKQDDAYKNRIIDIENKKEKEQLEITDKKSLKQLLANKISPTQVENFYTCPFNYFCKYIMNIKTEPTAKLNAPSLGVVVHKILEEIVSKQDFLKLTQKELKIEIKKELTKFLEDYLGGIEGKTARFIEIYYNNETIISKLCENIQAELQNGKYTPIGYEVKVGDKVIPPIVLEIDNNTCIKVVGKIDRIDICEMDNKRYIRVIDYKTGKKRIDFGEIYNGLNLQMLLYLLSIYKSSEVKKKKIVPAGILYLPASGKLKEYVINSRSEDLENNEIIIKKGFRANGIILEDRKSIQAMEDIKPGETGQFLELRVLKNGAINKSDASKFLVTTVEMDSLFNFAQNQVKKMYKSIIHGRINKSPIINLKKVSSCEYCDYKPSCGHTPSSSDKEIKSITKEEFFELYRESEDKKQ